MDKKLLAMADYIEANSLDPKNFPITDYVRIEDLTTQEERDFYNSKFLERYSKAIAKEPKVISHYKVRAEFYALDAKTYSKAIEDYTKILEIEPSNENAVDEKLRLLLELKKLPEAVVFLNKILEVNSENEPLFNKRNECLKELKRCSFSKFNSKTLFKKITVSGSFFNSSNNLNFSSSAFSLLGSSSKILV